MTTFEGRKGNMNKFQQTIEGFHSENDTLIQEVRDRFKFFQDHQDELSRQLLLMALREIIAAEGK